jgi:hypothetical protein
MRTVLTTFMAASLLLGACSTSTPVSDAVRTRATSGGPVVLSEVTAFPWEAVHVFGPYASRESVCKALDALWADCKEHVPHAGVPEGAYLTAFSDGSRVVHHEFHPRRNGEYCLDSCQWVLQKNEAVFTVVASPATGDGNDRFSLVRRAP